MEGRLSPPLVLNLKAEHKAGYKAITCFAKTPLAFSWHAAAQPKSPFLVEETLVKSFILPTWFLCAVLGNFRV